MIRSIILALVVLVLAASSAEAFTAKGSAEQVYVTGLAAGARAMLVNGAGKNVATRTANPLGGMLFRNVKPGSGYRVKGADGTTSDALTVLSDQPAPPSTDSYNQTIPSDGYGYMTTRDGTQLAFSVHPPQDVSNAAGLDLPHLPISPSYPTLVEYSDYGYADPAGPQSGIAALANIRGFAVVDVNMRGPGCWGGAFAFFEPLQSLDGYDIVETVARQSWVAHNKVGMLGISYGGGRQRLPPRKQPPSPAPASPRARLPRPRP